MPPKIENPAKVLLTPEAERILQRIFAHYGKIIIKKEFGSGLSGGRVFEVDPVRADGVPELPTVIKLAPVSLIQQEWQAYRQHVQNRLPRISQVTAPPALLQQIGWGGLRYTMMGEGAFEVVSMYDYCRQAETSVAQIRTVIDYLLRIMHNVWGHNYTNENFLFQASYDQMLPVNLLVQSAEGAQAKSLRSITPDNLVTESFQRGDLVCLQGFAVHKINRDTQTVTLRTPLRKGARQEFTSPAYFLRYKTQITETIAGWTAKQVVGPLLGEVTETRTSRLHEEVRRLLGETFNPNAQNVQLAGQSFANPLLAIPQLLSQSRPANIAVVHGDFNLENILIEPETGVVSLIDFADAREDHVLHDCLRLETEVITRLIPEILHKQQLPLAPTLATLFWGLHHEPFLPVLAPSAALPRELEKPLALLQALRRTARNYCSDAHDVSEYYQGLILYLLGALKFKNLNDLPEQPLPKQAAFWGATLLYHLLTESVGAGEPPTPPLAALLAQRQAMQPTTDEHPIVIQEAEAPTRAEAERRLAAIPIHSVAPLGPLPLPTRLPLTRNPLFIGRTQELKQMANALRGAARIGDDPVRPFIITGLGGLGKTQLVSEFAHRYGRFFAGGVFWLSFADARAIPAEVAACGGTNGLALRPDFAELPLDEQVRLVTTAWQADIPRLLIFDNCEDPELLMRWRPAIGGCRILVTSRRAEWSGTLGVQTKALDGLQRAESIALLREHRPDADEAMLDQLAEEVGDLPLALHLAGSYLARYRRSLTIAEYLTQLRVAPIEHHSLQSGGVSPTGHEQNISRTIALSFNRLDQQEPTDALALALLARSACLAPGEPIPYNLLVLTLRATETNLPHTGALPRPHTPHSIEDAVNRLAELGLLRSTTPAVVQVHRLILAFVQNAQQAEIPVARLAVENALCQEAEQLNQAGYPGVLLSWQVHLRTVVNQAFNQNAELIARLCHALGEHFRQIGDYGRARIGLERAVAIRQKVFGTEHENTARTLTDLGAIFWAQQAWNQAHACYAWALMVQEEKLGEQADTAMTLSHLGMLAQYRGELDSARPYHERALAIRRTVLGTEHPLIAQTLCNLAYLDYCKHNFTQAQVYLEQALAVQRKAQGNEHPYTAYLLNNLGELRREQGDFAAAQTIFSEVFAIQQKVLAKEHPENARALHNLGWAAQVQGDLAKGYAYYEAALQIRRKVLGEEHADTAITWNDWGELRQAQGDLAGARACYERALHIFNARLGADHFRTRRSQDNLSALTQ